MADEIPAAPPPESPRKKLRIRYGPAPKQTSMVNFISGTLCVTAATGIVFAIVLPGLLSSQGARYSVRIEWQRRDAELDAAAEQARKEGKLPPAAETTPHE